MKNSTKPKNRPIINIVIGVVVTIAVSLVLEFVLLGKLNSTNNKRTISILLDEIKSEIVLNEKKQNSLISNKKEEYKTTAKSVAYLIDREDYDENSVSDLKQLAKIMSVDEIHIFNTEGVIYAGTNPDYYGMSITGSGDQMAYFKPMLSDKNLSMCQDMMFNTAEGKIMMYAMAWSSNKDKMIQIGITPTRLISEINTNYIPEMLNNIGIYRGLNVTIYNKYTGDIEGVTYDNNSLNNATIIWNKLSQMDLTEAYLGTIKIDGFRHYVTAQNCEDYVVMVDYSTESNLSNLLLSQGIVFIYLLIAGCIVLLCFHNIFKAQKDRDEQFQILKSLAGVYHTMHLIDLSQNSFIEYNSSEAVNSLIDDYNNASKMIFNVMLNVNDKDCVDRALDFCELSSLPARMKDKKILSDKFHGIHIGWYRAQFITIEQDAKGYPVKVFFTTTDINDEVEHETVLINRSTTDELTGFLNRRAYEEDVAADSKTIPRDNLVYISMDVNGLKVINDSKGHAAGDELLHGACECMKRCLGPYGRLYRTGGDEFVAIVSISDSQFDNVIRDFNETLDNWHGTLVDSVAVSFGYVKSSELDQVNIKSMSILADKRMYEAKSAFYQRSGVDRRGHNEARSALCALYTKILKINITDDNYKIINMNNSERTELMGFSDKISEWLANYANTGCVHSEDREEYLARTNLKYLREYFKDNKSFNIIYRRKYDTGFKKVMMEIIPAESYSADNQELYLYVKPLE